MINLGIDFETNGFDPEEHFITEIGAVLWDTETKQPIDMISQLVFTPGIEITDHITEVTGITYEMLEKHGCSLSDAITLIDPWLHDCDYVVAHNAAFDKSFLDAAYERLVHAHHPLKWICTRADVPYPKSKTRNGHSLLALAANHGFVNPFPHRAVTDVLTMFKTTEDYDWEEIAAISQEPKFELQAVVSFADKEKAKDRGYHWQADRKQWTKVLAKRYVEAEIEEANFPVKARPIDELGHTT